jgi:hypothetical protein
MSGNRGGKREGAGRRPLSITREPSVNINIRLPKELNSKVRDHCINRCSELSQFIREAIAEKLQREV